MVRDRRPRDEEALHHLPRPARQLRDLHAAACRLAAAHRASGRLPWHALFAPAIHLAQRGFAVSSRLHALLERDPLLRERAASRRYFYDDNGVAWPVGHRLRNPDYARTLRWLEENDFIAARWFEYDGRRERFDTISPNQPTGEHFHFRCRSCNQIIEFAEPVIESVRKAFEKTSGAQVDTVNLTFYGLCPRCQA